MKPLPMLPLLVELGTEELPVKALPDWRRRCSTASSTAW
jgi:glycyl-tRNA synthetase beta subunit